MGMEYGLVSLLRDRDEIRVISVKGKQKFGKILVESTEEKRKELEVLSQNTKFVYIKYLVERIGYRDISEEEKNLPTEMVKILYSLDGISYKSAIEMLSVPGRWVGVKSGMFCLSSKDNSTGKVTVDYVKYSKVYNNTINKDFPLIHQ